MSTRLFSMTFAGGDTQTLPGGIFFLIKSATAAVSVSARYNKSGRAPMQFTNVAAGLQYGPCPKDLRWDYLDITSATAQVVEVVVSDDAEVRVGSVVSVSGAVTTLVQPSGTIADTADTTQAASSQTTISANGARRRITIGVLSTSGNGVRVSQAGGANTRGLEIQPGTFVEFDTTAALIVRNADIAGTAANAVWYAEEET